MAYAREHSHRIRKMVLVDMGPEIVERAARGDGGAAIGAQDQPGFESEAAAMAHFELLYPSRSSDFYERQIAAGLVLDEPSGQLVFRFDPALHEAVGRGATVEVPFLWESLAHIKCPTLVVRAEKSKVLSREVQAEMIRQIPIAKGVEIADAGHQVPLHQPDEFIRVVQEFLAD